MMRQLIMLPKAQFAGAVGLKAQWSHVNIVATCLCINYNSGYGLYFQKGLGLCAKAINA